MLKQNVTMPASVLASVLVISTLIFIGILMVMSLWNSDLLYLSGYNTREQQKADLSSAIVRYCQDTAFCSIFQGDTSLVLFPEVTASEVKFRKRSWGLYEMLEVTAGQQKTFRLLGKAAESFYRAVLYIPERQRTLSVSGNSRVDGRLCLGEKGLAYTQIKAEFFSGIPIELSRIGRSGEEFLEPEAFVVGHIDDLFKNTGEALSDVELSGEESFGNPAVFRRVGREIRGVNLRGPYILSAADSLYIRGDCRLRGIIVVAGKVRIGQGFQGCLQVFARDSIILEEGVSLQAGSGLLVSGVYPGRLIRLGERCVIEGYVVVMGNDETPERPSAHYFQSSSCRVKGLVYVDGTAHIQGEIEGSLYVKELCYFAPEGYYMDLLYGLSLCRQPGIVYPIFMKSPAERREVR